MPDNTAFTPLQALLGCLDCKILILAADLFDAPIIYNKVICDKKSHNELLYATPSIWGNPTEICVSSNAGV